MHEDQKVKCISRGRMFTSEINVTLCSVCSKGISQMISSFHLWDYKTVVVVVVTINSFQN